MSTRNLGGALLILLAVHAVLGIGILVSGPRTGRAAFALAAIAPAAAVVWAVAHVADVRDGGALVQRVEWVPELGLAIEMRFDGFAFLMTALVSGIGLLVFAYAASYMGHSRSSGRLAGLLLLFSGAMLGLVLADNLLWLFVCWELTSITSYLLIGHDHIDERARSSALQALLITGGGGLAMLAGFVLLGVTAGTMRISELTAGPVAGPLVPAAAVLVLVGAFTKSAQYPFHSWLPGAMVAPTPISAYLHSAAMVKAGVYLVLRLNPAFDATDVWSALVVGVGLVTMLAGALRAVRQVDLKLLLAHGTVSQLGFLMVLAGTGTESAVAAACALLVAHGAFKAALFMVVGIIDHQAHTRDLRELGGLAPPWRPTIAVAVVSAASMAGVVPLAGFLAKESALDALADGATTHRFVLAGVVVASAFTVAYSARFVWGAFVAKGSGPDTSTSMSPPPPSHAFVAPAALLATVTLVLGLVPNVFDVLAQIGAEALNPRVDVSLALWHGVTVALVLSVVVLSSGAVLFVARDRVDHVQHVLRPRWSGQDAYDGAVRGLLRAAHRSTGIAQPGSLPLYAGIVLLTAAAVPGAALIARATWPGWPELVTSAGHVPAAVLICAGAIATLFVRRRFASALLLGAVGYGMALLFVIHGAPDLALTQFAIETLTVVLFLLVLRFLPDSFEHRPPRIGHLFRVVVSATVGVFVFAILVLASAARREEPVSSQMVVQALPEAGGRNIVNVILVDFRGLDTLGEITVLAVAAVGAVALARRGPRREETR